MQMDHHDSRVHKDLHTHAHECAKAPTVVHPPGELREEAQGGVLHVHDATEQVQGCRDRPASGARTELWRGQGQPSGVSLIER